jgi:biotin carboxyl carrier protein
MDLDISIKGKTKMLKLLEREGNQVKIKVDDKILEADVVKTSAGVYSLLHKGISYDFELSEPGISGKKFSLHNRNRYFDITVTDAQSKYMQNRQGEDKDDGTRVISSPMPGAIVKIPVKVGDKVKQGDVVIIVEAMKMQSEYKAGGNRTVKKVLVKEGQNIQGDQPLVILE